MKKRHADATYVAICALSYHSPIEFRRSSWTHLYPNKNRKTLSEVKEQEDAFSLVDLPVEILLNVSSFCNHATEKSLRIVAPSTPKTFEYQLPSTNMINTHFALIA